ncbi:MAG TPA: CDP-alcohol phosphatidyltransferase family protein [Anaerolineae bacterium]|nr:CDP-alcohol phosphatidyltransferase family protein [Anaerolineae bacterium]
MLDESTFFISRQKRIAAWLVHLFTASGAIFGLLSLWAIHEGQYIQAFWLMAVAVFIDSVDGALARRAQTKVAAPRVDGALLDNMVDYFTYVIVPGFFILATDLLPPGWGPIGASAIVLASAYQFTQSDAKTSDHYFKGFPSYWNIVVFYLFVWQTSAWINLVVVLVFALLVFVPIKCVYPSRLDYLSPNRWLRRGMLGATLMWAAATAAMLLMYPNIQPVFVYISVGYAVFYTLISLYRTFVPPKFTDMED